MLFTVKRPQCARNAEHSRYGAVPLILFLLIKSEACFLDLDGIEVSVHHVLRGVNGGIIGVFRVALYTPESEPKNHADE